MVWEKLCEEMRLELNLASRGEGWGRGTGMNKEAVRWHERGVKEALGSRWVSGAGLAILGRALRVGSRHLGQEEF